MEDELFFSKEAMFYEKREGEKVQCLLCPRECVIRDRERGFCRNRENRKGTLYSLVYARPAVVDIGPIEKAPLYHFIPGHLRLCLTCASCNLRCRYCQNWHLSQSPPEKLGHELHTPHEIVENAERWGLSSVSFTYTEPTVYYEYAFDVAHRAKEKGLRTSIVSNGYIRKDPLLKLLSVLDAVKIDLKGFSENFYQEVCSASLKPVLESLKLVKREKVWLEIVNLVIPSLNEDLERIGEMCQWIKENLGIDTPLHFTRFFPNYELRHLPPTPLSLLESACEVAQRTGLRYVYLGNVPGHPLNSTYCPSCHHRLIHRSQFDVLEMKIEEGRCGYCGFSIPGRWGERPLTIDPVGGVAHSGSRKRGALRVS